MSTYEQVAWARVKDVLLGWPGERGMTEKTWGGYYDGLASWSDPQEVEDTLRDMRDHDERGQRPPLGLIRKEVVTRRQRKLAEARRRRAAEQRAHGNPLPDLAKAPNPKCEEILLHAAKRGFSIAPAAVVRWSACAVNRAMRRRARGREDSVDPYGLLGEGPSGANLGLYAGILWAAAGGYSDEALYGNPMDDAAWEPPYTAVWPGEVDQEENAEENAARGRVEIAKLLWETEDHDERVRALLAAYGERAA